MSSYQPLKFVLKNAFWAQNHFKKLTCGLAELTVVRGWKTFEWNYFPRELFKNERMEMFERKFKRICFVSKIRIFEIVIFFILTFKMAKKFFLGEIWNVSTLIGSKTFSLSRILYMWVFFVCSRSISIEWYQKHYDIWHSKKFFDLNQNTATWGTNWISVF